jgi:hypothetical protein
MSCRTLAFLGLVLGAFTALAAETLSYSLVYPAATRGSKLLIAVAVLLGVFIEGVAVAMCWRALHRSVLASERFFGVLALALSGFFLFVVLFGFGIPGLVLGVKD